MTVNTELLRRAIDWLRANPDRHITGHLAANSKGDYCEPTDDDAQCFCMLGRMAKEADLVDPKDRDYFAFITKAYGLGDEPSAAAFSIWTSNDRHKADELGEAVTSPFCERLLLSNQEVLDYLEQKYLS